MESRNEVLNRFLVEVFHEILTTEERRLAARFRDLTIREFHLIGLVCAAVDGGEDNRATAIAAAQGITAGSLTTAVTLLENKGYLERRRDEKDRRSVRLYPTERGRRAALAHGQFHRDMVAALTQVLSPEETEVLARALSALAQFFRGDATCAP